MKRLAVETATEHCSVALAVDDEVRMRERRAPRAHARLVLPWARELLAEAGIGFGDLDSLAVTRGPGGFTSLRIGLGIVQGIALARDLPVHPVSTLAALAHAADPEARVEWLLAVIDARMNEVYAGWFEGRDGHHRSRAPEVVSAPGALVIPGDGPWLVAGSGLAACGDQLRQRLGNRLGQAAPEIHPDARSVLALADAAEPVPPWSLEPVYLRDRVTQQ